jgi:hypothetical protein
MSTLLHFPQVPPFSGVRARWPAGLPFVRDLNTQADALRLQAVRLYPDSAYLQREWMRAVGVVRRSTGGWLLERKVQRHA